MFHYFLSWFIPLCVSKSCVTWSVMKFGSQLSFFLHISIRASTNSQLCEISQIVKHSKTLYTSILLNKTLLKWLDWRPERILKYLFFVVIEVKQEFEVADVVTIQFLWHCCCCIWDFALAWWWLFLELMIRWGTARCKTASATWKLYIFFFSNCIASELRMRWQVLLKLLQLTLHDKNVSCKH